MSARRLSGTSPGDADEAEGFGIEPGSALESAEFGDEFDPFTALLDHKIESNGRPVAGVLNSAAAVGAQDSYASPGTGSAGQAHDVAGLHRALDPVGTRR